MPTPRRVLDLGCGNDKLPGAIGIDINPGSAADIVRSLDDTPWPLETSSFDFVRAQDVLEHVDDFIKVVDEIYRVCRDGATVEVRMPFMDWRLVCYIFSLPDESKVGGGVTKRVLREAMRGIIPEKIRTRKPKIGFISPLQNWLNGDLGNWVWHRVGTKRFLESDIWDGVAIRDFIESRHRSKTWSMADGWRVWRYLQADLWREAFFA